MRDVSERLLALIAAAEPRLRKITEPESAQPLLAGGWSARQVLGHLIDSASNNHQRFIRAALQPSLDFPAYDQTGNVALQVPQDVEWSLLVDLWTSYNRYLAHVITRLPVTKLDTPCRIGDGEPVTLGFLATDYLTYAPQPSPRPNPRRAELIPAF